jgi:hypothetical protein
MSEVHLELETPFTTADTEGPLVMHFSGATLSVTFSNFRTPPQTVVFHYAREFSWTGWDHASADAKPDSVYEITGSALLAPFTRFAAGGLRFRHFRLGFNAEGKFLDVIATGMELQKG